MPESDMHIQSVLQQGLSSVTLLCVQVPHYLRHFHAHSYTVVCASASRPLVLSCSHTYLKCLLCHGYILQKSISCGVRVCLQISGVVYMFRYPPQTALAVGLSMAQIGEFAFVLLSVASQLGLMPYQVYMLLMGEPLPGHFCPPCLWAPT